MDDGSRLPILISILLLAGAVYFALAETAFSSCSRVRMRAAAERGEPGAKQALYILDHFERAITTMLIGTNICHLFFSALVTVVVTRRWGLSAVAIGTVIETLIVFFAGEMLPKSIAKKFPERLSKSCAGSLRFFMGLFRPLSAVLAIIGKAFAKKGGRGPELSVTEDELYDIIESMTEEGSLDDMDVAALDADADGDETLSVIKAENHSRLPVYEGSIDHVIGVLQIRKYIKAYLREKRLPDLRSLMDEAFFVHQSTELSELLPMLSKQRTNMAIVTDNFGGTLGVVTVEDIVEQIVGEIWDEDDVVEEAVTDLSENACIADANESVSDLFEHLNYEDPEHNDELVDTRLGEWAYRMFDTIPSQGDSFRYHDLVITAHEMDGARILTLKIVRDPQPAEGGRKS